MVEVKVHRVLPVAMDTTLTLVVADIMVIMVSPMVMMVAIQMTHTVHFQKVPHLLSQTKDVGKTDRIGMLYKFNFKKYDNHDSLLDLLPCQQQTQNS